MSSLSTGKHAALARRVTSLRSPSLPLRSEHALRCTWAVSAVSRPFHASSRVSPSLDASAKTIGILAVDRFLLAGDERMRI